MRSSRKSTAIGKFHEETAGVRKFYVEGNKGGDYLRLEAEEHALDEGPVKLEVGHGCVVIMRVTLPVEVLTGAFAQMGFEGILEAFSKVQWPREYMVSLAHQVVDGMPPEVRDKLPDSFKDLIRWDEPGAKGV